MYSTAVNCFSETENGPLTETITSLLLTTAKNSEGMAGWGGVGGGGGCGGRRESLARRQSRSYYRSRVQAAEPNRLNRVTVESGVEGKMTWDF